MYDAPQKTDQQEAHPFPFSTGDKIQWVGPKTPWTDDHFIDITAIGKNYFLGIEHTRVGTDDEFVGTEQKYLIGSEFSEDWSWQLLIPAPKEQTVLIEFEGDPDARRQSAGGYILPDDFQVTPEYADRLNKRRPGRPQSQLWECKVTPLRRLVPFAITVKG